MPPSDQTLEPVFSNAESDELGHLEYFLAKLAELRDRGLIAPEAYDTAARESQGRRASIDRAGQYEACMVKSRGLTKSWPKQAVHWAEQAIQVDRDRIDAWRLIVDLCWSQEDDQAAIAWCAKGAEHFPELHTDLERFRAEVAPREERRLERARNARLEEKLSEHLQETRKALEERRFSDAAAICDQILAQRPDQLEALANKAFALRNAGEIDRALEVYGHLMRLEPRNSVWTRWVQELRKELDSGAAAKKSRGGAPLEAAPLDSAPLDGKSPPDAVFIPAERSWSGFTSEFVKEHWQKLILSLAVLLIVVSSTVGAHLLLGDLLWSPEGKCTLALAGTLLLAALGTGLEHWGAGRAGRMMLVTTLIVVPIHFMLAGELRLLFQPPSLRLLFLAAIALVLVALVRWTSGRLAEPRGAWLLTASLLLISLGSAATTRGSSIAAHLQFACFLLAPLVFLATVFAMGKGQWGSSEAEHREYVFTMFGVLGFALFSCLIRAGAYVLRLDTALYALPTMLGAISVVLACRRLAPFEPDKKRLALFELGGYSLSGLAFALAFSSPYDTRASFSANIVAVSALGVALYSVALWNNRHPAFLYFALGSYLSIRVGLWYFVAERFHALEAAIALVLGYSEHLPLPYRSIIAVLVNLVLAALAIWFTRRWKDTRLARHCHYLGLPLSLAACAWSTLEPQAACICLSAYAILFLLGVWVFAAPEVTYLSVTATAGAFYFGSTLFPGTTISGQALLAAAIGCAHWSIKWLLWRLHVDEMYRRPWFHAAMALLLVGLAAGTAGVLAKNTGIATGTITFALLTALALLLYLESAIPFWAYVAFVSLLELTVCATGMAAPERVILAHELGLLVLGNVLVVLAVSDAIRGIKPQSEPPAARAIDRQWALVFRAAAGRFAIAATAAADGLALLDMDRAWASGIIFLLGCVTFLWSSRIERQKAVVYLGLAHLTAATLDLTWWATAPGHVDIRLAWLGLAAAALALSLWMAAALLRRTALDEIYTGACLETAFLLTVVAFVGALDARYLGREAFRLGVAALVTNAVVTMLLLATWRRCELVYSAVFHLVAATYLVLFSTGNNDPAMAYVLGFVAVLEALALWVAALSSSRAGNPLVLGCAGPLGHWAIFMTGLAVLLCAGSSLSMALVALSLLLAVKGFPRAEWLYGTIAALAVACYWRWLETWSGLPLVGLVLLAAFGLWTLAMLIARGKLAICRVLGLSRLPYEYPFFNAAIAAGAITLALRVSLSRSGSVAWTAEWWLPLGLAHLCVLMVRAYPSRICMHAALSFLTWSIVGLIAPSLESLCSVALAGTGLAGALLALERFLRPIEPALCDRAGVVDVEFSPVLRVWARTLAGISACLAAAVLVDQIVAALIGPATMVFAVSPADWWAMAGAIGLLGAFVVVVGSDPDGPGPVEPEHLVVAFHWVIMASVWWLGVASSPIMVGPITAAMYYPLATAMAALATAQLTRRFAHADGWKEFQWLPDLRSDPMTQLFSIQPSILAILAVLFTRGETTAATAVSALFAALALGQVAIGTGWTGAAVAASLSWELACAIAGLLVASQLERTGLEPRSIYAGAGSLAAAYLLWKLAGILRNDGSIAKWRFRRFSGSSETSLIPVALALEWAALASTLVAAIAVLLAGSQPGLLWNGEKVTGVGLLMVAAALLIMLVPRWKREWLVYLAQAMIVAAYVDFRMAFQWPIAADAAVLTLLGYLDLGLAELLDRQKQTMYARPARFTSLVLPVLPLLQLLWIGGTNEVVLFHLVAAATFYSVACGQMRWKSLGYAAGVLYNAALWVLWSIFGWELRDHFQFFMVPVGFSTILFAESQRHELGRSTVNSIRSAGLLIIYASLAVPIWQFASFGAWLTLLVASLAGIFLGIGLRLQTFLWLGLATFVLDVVYEMGRVSLDHAMAKWAIMLALGLCLVLFVALNEKKRIVATMRLYYDQTRLWE
jgi:tetratricopeptide (TPR) repeat protein